MNKQRPKFYKYVETNSCYCHEWQAKIAYLLNDHTNANVFTVVLHSMKYLSRRQLLTIKPLGQPDKLWYGFEFTDINTGDDMQTVKIPPACFVGWLPANESTLLHNTAGSYEVRTRQFSNYHEHIGALEATHFIWNVALTKWELLLKQDPAKLEEIKNIRQMTMADWCLHADIMRVLKEAGHV